MMFTTTRAAEWKAFCAQPGATAAGDRILKRLVTFATNIAIAAAKAKDPNFDEARARLEVDEAVKAIGDGKIWEWLINGGFEQLLNWIMLIIGLIGG